MDKNDDVEALRESMNEALIRVDPEALAKFIDGYIDDYMERERIVEMRKKKGKFELERVYEDE